AAWLFAVFVRKDAARIRYWVWLAASLKFLVPFAFLGWVGSHFILQLDRQPSLLPIMQHVAAPLTTATISTERLGHPAWHALIMVWLFGCHVLLYRWIAGWAHSRALVMTSTACEIVAAVPVRCSTRLAAPAVVGIFNPVILLPVHTLSIGPAQIEAVIAHEVWHVRRRDNLAGALHALVQILFWFHPLVWWMGAKLVQEREYACDEGAIEDGHDATAYAETLLSICRHLVVSRPLCTASAMGGDLSARVRSIVSKRVPSRTALLRRSVLVAALIACAVVPVTSGMTIVATSALQVVAGAHSIQESRPDELTFVVVRDDYVYARNVSLRELISEVYAVHAREVMGYDRGLDYPRYDVALRAPRSGESDHRQLVADLLKRQFNVELVVQPTLRAVRTPG
ncbi:MAG TPA: M56 family metallopeptidase, partial [Povalibacter sp.]|nr:M56 family metallopeptidase [Povalibacter sp.]